MPNTKLKVNKRRVKYKKITIQKVAYLGTLLFVIYINDVVTLFGQDCVCKLYADDLKLYTHTVPPNCKTS